jgi:hypothetical protein
MAWGRSNENWNHTASLMTLLASIHSDPSKGSPPTLATYHPYLPEPEIPEATPEVLAALGIAMRRHKPAEVTHGG